MVLFLVDDYIILISWCLVFIQILFENLGVNFQMFLCQIVERPVVSSNSDLILQTRVAGAVLQIPS